MRANDLILRRMLIPPALLATLAGAAPAQTPPGISRRMSEADCESAARAVGTAGSARARADALQAVSECPRVGPALVADSWRGAGVQNLEPTFLWATLRLRDRRVATALRAVARDPSRPRAVRLRALQSLVPFVYPHRNVTMEMLERPDRWRDLRYVTHVPEAVGTDPIDDGDREATLAAMRQLAAGDADTVIRDAAAYLYRKLSAQRRLDRGGKDRG